MASSSSDGLLLATLVRLVDETAQVLDLPAKPGKLVDLIAQGGGVADLLAEPADIADLASQLADLTPETGEVADLPAEGQRLAHLLAERRELRHLVSERREGGNLVAKTRKLPDLVPQPGELGDLVAHPREVPDVVAKARQLADLVVESHEPTDLAPEGGKLADLLAQGAQLGNLVTQRGDLGWISRRPGGRCRGGRVWSRGRSRSLGRHGSRRRLLVAGFGLLGRIAGRGIVCLIGVGVALFASRRRLAHEPSQRLEPLGVRFGLFTLQRVAFVPDLVFVHGLTVRDLIAGLLGEVGGVGAALSGSVAILRRHCVRRFRFFCLARLVHPVHARHRSRMRRA